MLKNFRREEKLTADWVNEVNKFLTMLKNMSGAGGIRVSKSPGSITIANTGGEAGAQAGVFTVINPEGEDYPEEGDDPCPYWAQQDLTPEFVEELGGEYSNDSTGEDTLIFNLSEDHIPVGTRLLCWKISGQWWTYFRAVSDIRVVEGVLTSNLSSGGTATMDVWDKDRNVTGESITVRDRAGWAGTTGQYIKAIRCGLDFEYRPDVIGCVATEV